MKKTMTNNGKRWQQGATGFLCALLLVATLVGCKDNDPIPKDLKTEVQTLDVEKGGTASFLITEGNDKYTVTSDHPEVATASVKDNTVSVTGISQGTATLIVTDTPTGKTVQVVVTVTGDIVLSAGQLHVEKDSVAMFTITEGNGAYALSFDNTGIAKASIEDGTVTVTGVSKGKTNLTVTDNRTNKKASIAITVTDDIDACKIILTTQKKPGETIQLKIDAEAGDRARVWIDLNNNHIREANESITSWGLEEFSNYTIGASTLTLYGKVTNFVCSENQLTRLEVADNPVLLMLGCQKNLLPSLDVSRNKALVGLGCFSNQLNTLNLSHNNFLLFLDCSDNRLRTLDVGNNPLLSLLYCSYNQLKTLDISRNTLLEELECFYNQLNSLMAGNNPALKLLQCYSNQLRGAALDRLINALPTHPLANKGKLYFIDTTNPQEGNKCTESQFDRISRKNWNVYVMVPKNDNNIRSMGTSEAMKFISPGNESRSTKTDIQDWFLRYGKK